MARLRSRPSTVPPARGVPRVERENSQASNASTGSYVMRETPRISRAPAGLRRSGGQSPTITFLEENIRPQIDSETYGTYRKHIESLERLGPKTPKYRKDYETLLRKQMRSNHTLLTLHNKCAAAHNARLAEKHERFHLPVLHDMENSKADEDIAEAPKSKRNRKERQETRDRVREHLSALEKGRRQEAQDGLLLPSREDHSANTPSPPIGTEAESNIECEEDLPDAMEKDEDTKSPSAKHEDEPHSAANTLEVEEQELHQVRGRASSQDNFLETTLVEDLSDLTDIDMSHTPPPRSVTDDEENRVEETVPSSLETALDPTHIASSVVHDINDDFTDFSAGNQAVQVPIEVESTGNDHRTLSEHSARGEIQKTFATRSAQSEHAPAQTDISGAPEAIRGRTPRRAQARIAHQQTYRNFTPTMEKPHPTHWNDILGEPFVANTGTKRDTKLSAASYLVWLKHRHVRFPASPPHPSECIRISTHLGRPQYTIFDEIMYHWNLESDSQRGSWYKQNRLKVLGEDPQFEDHAGDLWEVFVNKPSN